MVTKKPRATVSDVLARMTELEERIARLEAARDAAVSGLVAARPPLGAGQGGGERAEEAGRRPAEAAAAGATTAALAGPDAPREEIGEEVMLVIAAAVAAFLGERAHVRQVRLLSSEAWAQQGRVSVMASHRWAVQR
jgi:methylmalonyl-CoA carboxyltransferase large subunit